METIRPSGGHEWYFCHGSQAMKESMPNDDSDATREGTAAHHVAETLLRSYVDVNKEIKTSADFVDKLAPNNVLMTEEMYQGAIDYVTDILKYCNKNGMSQYVHIEQKLNIDSIFEGMKGTPNCWLYNPNTLELIVWDFKFGHGHVEIFENPQIMPYVAGLFDLLKIDGISDQLLTVNMRIVQPRSYHSDGPIREWIIKGSDLRPYFNKLRFAAAQTMLGDGLCTPGTHCRHCNRNECSALQATVYNTIDVIKGPERINLTNEEKGIELHLLERISKLIEYRLSAVKADVETLIKSNTPIAGYRIKEAFGRERWKKDLPIENVLMVGDAMGIDIRKPENVDTPNQTRKKLTKKAKELGVDFDAEIINQYTETPFNGYKVVEDDNSFYRKAFPNK